MHSLRPIWRTSLNAVWWSISLTILIAGSVHIIQSLAAIWAFKQLLMLGTAALGVLGMSLAWDGRPQRAWSSHCLIVWFSVLSVSFAVLGPTLWGALSYLLP
ncbi:MAG: hypothetical protein OWS74_06575 [Firmicutes bacterium]|nr:hypothetical protein [Bacillota bacterium]